MGQCFCRQLERVIGEGGRNRGIIPFGQCVLVLEVSTLKADINRPSFLYVPRLRTCTLGEETEIHR